MMKFFIMFIVLAIITTVVLLLKLPEPIEKIASFAVITGVFVAVWATTSASKAVQAQLYTSLTEEYASKRMYESLRLLRIINDAEKFQEWLKMKDDNTMAKDMNEVTIGRIKEVIEKKVPNYRDFQRYVKYYFLKIHRSYIHGFLPRRLFKALLSVDGIELFFDVVQPLENLEKEKFNNSEFNNLCKKAKKLKIKAVLECKSVKQNRKWN